MDFYIQMGHIMQQQSIDHISDWGGGHVIISPLNIKPHRINNFAQRVKKRNGNILLDPQIYFPRKEHKNLAEYNYWPKNDITLLFSEEGNFDNVLEPLIELNNSVYSEALILPSFTATQINKRWNYVQRNIIESAKRLTNDYKLIHTVSLSNNVLMDELQVESIVSFVEEWDVNGIYIVAEHPDNAYLVDNPLWLSNLLALVAGVKRQQKHVIVGYASHQLLCLALAKCDAIASGNFLNLRCFKANRFETSDLDKISRRALWYYCPQTLSEYKVPFLDIAKRMEVLESLAPFGNMRNPYSEMLFGPGLPTSTGYSERHSHRHYIWCLREQSLAATRSSYKETLDAQQILLETAERLLFGLKKKGIRGQDRDFTDYIDVNRSAITVYDSIYGYVLSNEWSNI